jgi:hypothetical protein
MASRKRFPTGGICLRPQRRTSHTQYKASIGGRDFAYD